MRISIFGLGYVGAVSAGCLADLGHQVIGVDINQRKVEMINGGHSPVVEERIDELIKAAVAKGTLHATTDTAQAVRDSEVSFISVGTPSKSSGAPALEALDAVVAEIGKAIKGKAGEHTIVVRSTIPPRTTEDRVRPSLEANSGRKVGQNLHLVFNPEFLREGSSVKDFYDPPFTIIGSTSERGYQVVEEIYGAIKAPVIRTDMGVAESVKCLSNAFHALKIAFANEAGAILKGLGIDGRKVMEIFCQDRQLNISPAYLRPGFAFGGSCLPKDVRALVSYAKAGEIDVPLLGNIMTANEAHVERALGMIIGRGLSKVALVGLALKPGNDDLRESPLLTLSERLIGKGFELTICDRFVESSRLMGKNREFIAHEIPHFERLLVDDPVQALKDAQIIVVGHVRKPEIDAILAHHGNRPIIDLQGVAQFAALPGVDYERIC